MCAKIAEQSSTLAQYAAALVAQGAVTAAQVHAHTRMYSMCLGIKVYIQYACRHGLADRPAKPRSQLRPLYCIMYCTMQCTMECTTECTM